MTSWAPPPDAPRSQRSAVEDLTETDGWLGFAAAVVVVYAVVVLVDAYARGQVIAWPF